jgi:hypothetical protein
VNGQEQRVGITSVWRTHSLCARAGVWSLLTWEINETPPPHLKKLLVCRAAHWSKCKHPPHPHPPGPSSSFSMRPSAPAPMAPRK